MTDTSSGTVGVIVSPHPFSVRTEQAEVAAGTSVADILATVQPDEYLRRHAHVYLKGEYLPRKMWKRVYPKAGASLHVRMAPSGGGRGKNPLRTILSIAVMAASPFLSAGLTGVFGAAAGRFITAGVNLVGRLAVNALAPPPKPRFAAGRKESPTLFIQGARNSVVPFGRVPKVLGRHRFVPPLGALPYTETVGNDQYLRMLFVWGYGPLQISDLKIGETPLGEFDSVEIETREGREDDAPLTLYTGSVLQNDLHLNLKQSGGYVVRTTEADADELSVDITLPRGLFKFNSNNNRIAASVHVEVQYSPAGMNTWSAGAEDYMALGSRTSGAFTRPGPYTYNNQAYTVTRIDRLVMDKASGALKILAGAPKRQMIDADAAQAPAVPEGYHPIARVERRSSDAAVIPSTRITDERDPAQMGVSFEAAGDFLATSSGVADTLDIAAGGLKFKGIYLIAKRTAALRQSVGFKVPKGQYDVRMRRLTPDAALDTVFDETHWTAIRTVRYASPVRMKNLAMTAIRIKATDQLQGVVDRFNGVVHSILPDWNGTAWTEQVTSNPASLFRHVLQGVGNARPLADTRIDLSRIEAWHEACALQGREFNAVIDYDISVREMLEDIAATGRASPTLIDGKWSVVEDKPQSVPVQHFTPRNTFNFKGGKSFEDLPQALRIRFINRERGYLQDERLVYDDAYTEETASKYETLELNGVTDPQQAWKDGRYHIATARLRPETYSFQADIEHIVCTRGDLVRFSHDVPMFGISSARVKSVAISGDYATGVVLDAVVEMEASKSYTLRCRKADGSSVILPLVTQTGKTRDLVFLDNVLLEAGPHAGDLALFGESGTESVELVVKSIEPGPDLSARITCVDAAPAIHLADIGVIPAFSSQITVPPELRRPPAPVLAEVQSGEETLIRHTDGSFTARIMITLEQPLFEKPLSLQAMIRAADETQFRPAAVLTASQDSLSITDITEGEIYDIQLRYVTASGSLSQPLLIAGHRVTGTASLPSDVGNLSLNVLGDTAHLSWMAVGDIDLNHYVLRYAPDVSGVLWSNAVDIIMQVSRDATSVSLPAASGTYLMKAVDVGGRMSENAAAVVSTIAGLSGYNAVMTVNESPAFAGARTGVGLSGQVLQLEGGDSIDDWAGIDALSNTDIGETTLLTEGSYVFEGVSDLGAVYTSRLMATMVVDGLDVNSSIDTWDDFDEAEYFDQDVDPSLWSVSLQLSTTEDDPSGTPAWSSWAPFVIGDYTARAFRFRVLLQSHAVNVTPALSYLAVDIDMPERTASARNIASNAAGSAVGFDIPFRAVPVISVTAQNMATGDYYAITSPSASGFSIRFFNSAGTGISRNFDYLAVGYGEQL